jgi:ubiquitin carboxyl-terminal hydrolase L3
MEWPCLESDPEIFTALMHRLGLAPEWYFEEAMIIDFLDTEPAEAAVLIYDDTEDVFRGEFLSGTGLSHIRQIEKLDNACGLLACLHAVLNSAARESVSGLLSELQTAFASGGSSEENGNTLANHPGANSIHVEFAATGQSEECEGETNYHYIAFTPGSDGQIIVHDGMKPSPVTFSTSTGPFLTALKQTLQGFVAEEKLDICINVLLLKRTF